MSANKDATPDQHLLTDGARSDACDYCWFDDRGRVHGGLAGTTGNTIATRLLTFRWTCQRLGDVNVVNDVGLDTITAPFNLQSRVDNAYTSLSIASRTG